MPSSYLAFEPLHGPRATARPFSSPVPVAHAKQRGWRVVTLLVVLLLLLGCGRTQTGSPEAVADAFADAYFRRADQQAAKAYTAFGASKMLDRELADVKQVREEGFSPSAAKLKITLNRGARSERNHRVRFGYTLRYEEGDITKYADIELTMVHGAWKVVRVGLSNTPLPATSG